MTDSEKDDVLRKLRDGSMDDLEAELLLKDWDARVGVSCAREDVMEACFAVLTAKVMPPRMGATVVAAEVMSRDAAEAGRLWMRLMALAEAGALEETQLMNWVYGHYFRRYDEVTLERFVRLAELAPVRERVGIAVMLGTWCGFGEVEGAAMQLIEKLGAGEMEREAGG